MVQRRLIKFLVFVVFCCSDMRIIEEVFVFFKFSDRLLFNSDEVLTSFGVLTKVISIATDQTRKKGDRPIFADSKTAAVSHSLEGLF